jgi:hypothetical protein
MRENAMRTTIGLCALLCLMSAGFASAQPTGCTPVSPGVQDGTFEAGSPWALWTVQTSTNFGTPLCDTLSCGTAVPPFAGTNWAWFGGAIAAENATLGQTITIPPGLFLFLRFQMRIQGVTTPFTDTLAVRVDGNTLATFVEPAVAEPAYTERYLNVTAFANGGPHALLFAYSGPTTGVANFLVDNVELVTCATPVELQDYRIE